MEFEFNPDGLLRYANNSSYKGDKMIRKEVTISPAVIEEVKRIIEDSEITREDDNNWPEPDRVGRQELEVKIGNEHISFTCAKIGSLLDIQESNDPKASDLLLSRTGLEVPGVLPHLAQLQGE
ncbi:unnamed protein product [Heterosigma akashiwo]